MKFHLLVSIPMKAISTLFLSTLFLLCSSSLLSQESGPDWPLSVFDYKKGKFATVYVLDNDDPDEALILVYQYKYSLEIIFLDEDLQFVRKISPKFTPNPIAELKVESVMNHDDHVYVFLNEGSFNSSLEGKMLQINKANGSFRYLSLSLQSPLTKDLSKSKVKLLKVFQFQDRFYKLWIDVKSSELYVYHYELGNHTVGLKQFQLSQDNIGKRLGRRQVIPTPLITDYHDASLVSNAKLEKIYMFPDEMIISLENQETGATELIVINTQTWEKVDEVYPVPAYLASQEEQLFNSFIFDGFLYQIVNNQEGLTLSKVDFETKETVAQQTWRSQESFEEDFSFRRMRKNIGSQLVIGEDVNVWKHLDQSLAVVLYPEGDQDRVMIGAHLYTDQTTRDVLAAVSIAASVASFASGYSTLWGGSGLTVSINPYESINYAVDAMLYFGDGRMFQADALFDHASMEPLAEVNEAYKWDKIMELVDAKEQEVNMRSMCLFQYREDVVLGYWRKKQYFLIRL